MRVRIWISGAEGSSRDFELVEPPRIGECISIATAGRTEEGVVTNVIWQLVGIERSGNDLVHGVEPVGSVTIVHVICQPPRDSTVRLADRASELALVSSDGPDRPSNGN